MKAYTACSAHASSITHAWEYYVIKNFFPLIKQGKIGG